MARVIHDREGDHIEVEATEARQGDKGRPVFWVLLFSTILAAIVLLAAWGFKADDLARTEHTPAPVAANTAN
ncbi:MAG: hypothetical protein KF842_11805 [Caulobacter sp.]|nr:hypothetical protein [Caulobacter sp.]